MILMLFATFTVAADECRPYWWNQNDNLVNAVYEGECRYGKPHG